ncbi:MAG: hypothetical protein LBV17_02810 [Treponema sp.]|jgi:hypothetical protein|nr:hypothetical protein [Treponema sp.]
MNKLLIVLFSIFILLIFMIIGLLSIPWLFAYQHQAVAFLGIFLILFTIPIMLFIIVNKSLKLSYLILYMIYFIITSYVSLLLSGIIQDYFFDNLPINNINIYDLFILDYIDIILILFALQSPIIISTIIIKNILINKNKITFRYFIKQPFFYIFIISLLFSILYFLHTFGFL